MNRPRLAAQDHPILSGELVRSWQRDRADLGTFSLRYTRHVLPHAGYLGACQHPRELGDIHEQYIWRFLRAQKIDLSGRKSWCESPDPEFVAKAADIVGPYMMPPANAVALSPDEKPSIQALERAQGYLKLPNGRAMIGQSHDYKCNGTTTLFAALDVRTRAVIGQYHKRRWRIEFLAFMNQMGVQHDGKEVHMILDNLSTHKPKRHMWLTWVAHVDRFISGYNDDARPFVWTKSLVHQKRLKPRFADQ